MTLTNSTVSPPPSLLQRDLWPFINVTVHRGEGTSAEDLPPSDWPVSKSVGASVLTDD